MYQPLGVQRLIYRTRIASYVKAGLIDYAVKVFEEMTLSECRVFGIDYNRFIGVLIRHSRLDLAHHYYSKMTPLGFSLSSFTYSRFISGLCQTKEFMFIEKLLNDMDRLHCVPDIWAFNIYLNLLFRENREESALEVFGRMVERGREPDVVTFTIIIDGLCKMKKFDAAVQFWRNMLDKGIRPDNKACGALAVGLCDGGQVDLAYELVIGVISGGLSEVSTLVYNALISGFCRAGGIDKALAIVSFMSRTGCKPDLVTYNVLLNYCCNEFMFEEAVKLLKKMECSATEPDVYSYNQLLKAFCKANHPDKAYQFMVTKMVPKGMGLLPDRIFYTTIIDHHCKSGKVEMAHNIFRDMVEKVTYKLIIGALVRENKLSDACRVWDQMMEKGLTLDRGISEMLINAIKS
ncbi:hypothetical protein OIU76_014291 [Salix suchowensis]|nr:hypothetical protein OIU76_014291 [Salix suchowensis]